MLVFSRYPAKVYFEENGCATRVAGHFLSSLATSADEISYHAPLNLHEAEEFRIHPRLELRTESTRESLI